MDEDQLMGFRSPAMKKCASAMIVVDQDTLGIGDPGLPCATAVAILLSHLLKTRLMLQKRLSRSKPACGQTAPDPPSTVMERTGGNPSVSQSPVFRAGDPIFVPS